MANTLGNIPPNATNDTVIATLNQIVDNINAQNRLDITNDNTTDRVLLGTYPPAGGPGSYTGLKIAKPGKDVKTATGDDLIFDSNQTAFKVIQTATVTIPGTGNQAPFANGATGLTVAHNLGSVPYYSAYVSVPVVPSFGQPPVTRWTQAFPTFASDSNQMTYNLQCGTDEHNIYFVNFWGNNGNTVPVQAMQVTYYLFTVNAPA